MLDEVFFAWERDNEAALAASGFRPWEHLRVLEVRGHEALSRPYELDVELVCRPGFPELDLAELVGRRAALRIVTLTNPPLRLVHGVIESAEELGDHALGQRYRVRLVPPTARASMMRKSLVFLDKTLREIIDATLSRSALGAGFVLRPEGADDGADDDGDPTRFVPATASFAWRVADTTRLDDRRVRPFCVQYEETDFAFVSRLLEEEGIGYHFVHSFGECILVLSDTDSTRVEVDARQPLGPGIVGRELASVRLGRRLRPTTVSLDDYNWRQPAADARTVSRSGVTDFMTFEQPGRYEEAAAAGAVLANVREEALDTERCFASASGRCRILGAGSVFELLHPNSRMSGRYLVTTVRHEFFQRGSFTPGAVPGGDPYVCRIEAVRCDPKAGSRFRPPRVTPHPRVVGSQTAIVTADPDRPELEINVGGPADIGCVRVRFRWDNDAGRLAREPSSCWVRVSQLFARARTGGLWHPRVGDEVIVEFLEGDPDRPIVTGRVYNGANLAPVDASQRPTWSAIQSATACPPDGSYNLIGFEDANGLQEIVVEAARDYNTRVAHNQSTRVVGSQSDAAGSIAHASGSTLSQSAATDFSMHAGGEMTAVSEVRLLEAAPVVDIVGGNNLNESAPFIDISASAKLREGAPHVEVNASGLATRNAPLIVDSGTMIFLNGGSIVICGGSVVVKGSTVHVDGGGLVDMHAGVINLNC